MEKCRKTMGFLDKISRSVLTLTVCGGGHEINLGTKPDINQT